MDYLTAYVQEHTRPTRLVFTEKKGDRPWNDPIPRIDEARAQQPTLKAVIFDMSAVMHVDVTSVQVFVDVRRQLSRHADPDPVHFYFASIRSPWTRRALASAGFGYAREDVKHVFSVAAASAGPVENEKRQGFPNDEESQLLTDDDKLESPEAEVAGALPISKWQINTQDLTTRDGKLLPINSVDRPFFSTDVDEAMASVLLNLGTSSANTRPASGPAGESPVPATEEVPQGSAEAANKSSPSKLHQQP